MDTRDKILNAAQDLAQTRGFNAYSYADVAEVVQIRKASIHHHFPAKADLEVALVQRYREQFAAELAVIWRKKHAAIARLKAFAALYQQTLSTGRLCLCGMMASDVLALPDAVQGPLCGFFDDQQQWLEAVLQEGAHAKEVQCGQPKHHASAMLAGLQGAMVIARATQNSKMLSTTMDVHLQMLTVKIHDPKPQQPS